MPTEITIGEAIERIMAYCSCCKKQKVRSKFSPDKRRKSGVGRYCKKCAADKKREKYRSNPEYREGIRKSVAKYRKENPGKVKKQKRDWELRNKYNIDTDDYDKMLVQQNNRCAICNKHISKINKTFHVDHNHKTGKVRALLCYTCNVRLAVVENLDFVKRAQEYLLKYE